MPTLAIDSAGNACSVCIMQDGEILASESEVMERGQDRAIIPMIMRLLDKARMGFDNLSCIAVMQGPGSFTGIRIGLAAARGLGLATQKDVIGVDRFTLYRTHFANHHGPLLVVLDSKRDEYYCRLWHNADKPEQPALMTTHAINTLRQTVPDLLVVGDVPELCAVMPMREVVALASFSAAAGLGSAGNLPRPFYIRPPDITFNSAALLLTPAKLDDAAPLSALHQECFAPGGWNVEQMKGSLILPTTVGNVAKINDAIVGFILCQNNGDEAEILTIAISPPFRRHGIGRKLIAKMAAQLATTGCKNLFLEVAKDNVAAHMLYKSTGFKPYGERKNYYSRESGPVDAILYRLTP